jgi:hypothetical protein
MRMEGMNLDAWGLYIPRPVSQRHSTPHSSPRSPSLQRNPRAPRSWSSHRPEYLAADRFPPEKLASAPALFCSGKGSQSATSMNSGSPSRHSSEAEEEDLPLQQSAFTYNQPMADSYTEDIT